MAMITEFWSGNSRVARMSASAALSRDAVAVFRGFPGEIPPGQEAKYAHIAGRVGIAQAVHEASGFDVYSIAYPGLGAERRAPFTFEASVTGSVAAVAELAARHARLHVVGYSWGGLVACNAARSLGTKRGDLALIAPVSDIPDSKAARELIAPVVNDYPNLFGPYESAVEGAVAAVAAAGARFGPARLDLAGGMGRALVIHGSRDRDVPIAPARALAARIGARFVELDDDHIFNADWGRMLDELRAFFRA